LSALIADDGHAAGMALLAHEPKTVTGKVVSGLPVHLRPTE